MKTSIDKGKTTLPNGIVLVHSNVFKISRKVTARSPRETELEPANNMQTLAAMTDQNYKQHSTKRN